MAKRKRASGAGRKPRGEFANLASPFSLRMPEALREQVNQAAARSGRSASQEICGDYPARSTEIATRDEDRKRERFVF